MSERPPIDFTCPHCLGTYKSPRDFLGQARDCCVYAMVAKDEPEPIPPRLGGPVRAHVRAPFLLERVEGAVPAHEDPIYRLMAPGMLKPEPVGMIFLGSVPGIGPVGTTYMAPHLIRTRAIVQDNQRRRAGLPLTPMPETERGDT